MRDHRSVDGWGEVMSETRVKVYRTPAEYTRDSAEAYEHGWNVAAATEQPDGTLKVWYHQTGTAGRVRPRKATWLVILWNVGIGALWLSVMMTAQGTVNGVYDPGLTRLGQMAVTVGIGFVWFIGFCVTALIWFMSRPRR